MFIHLIVKYWYVKMSTLRTVLTKSINKSSIIIYRNVAVTAAAVNPDPGEDTKDEGRPWKEIPGPSTLPVIGQMHHFLPGGAYFNMPFIEFTKKTNEEYGKIVRVEGLLGRPPMVLLFDPESAAQVLRGENLLPTRPGFTSLAYYRQNKNNETKETDQFTGLLTDQAEIWKRFRSAVNPVMMQPKTVKLYNLAIDEVAKDMISRLKSIKDDKSTIEAKFSVLINLWSLESIGVVALGGRLNCFDPNLPENSPARQLIKVVHDTFELIEKLDFRLNLWRYIATPTYKKAMHLYAEQERLTKHFIDIAKENLKTKPKTDEEKGVLEKLLDIDEKVAHIMASDMLFAGVDTTASTVIFTLYYLAINPEKQEKLREEIMTQSDKKAYLKACIKESLRLLSVVPGNLRQVLKEYNLLGYKIPKDILVAVMHQTMTVDEKNFKRAKEFIPERWIVPKEDPMYYGNAHPFTYTPFGFGSRMCIGRRIAELEVEIFLTRVMETFKVEWSGPPMKVKTTSLSYAQPPYCFTFKDLK